MVAVFGVAQQLLCCGECTERGPETRDVAFAVPVQLHRRANAEHRALSNAGR